MIKKVMMIAMLIIGSTQVNAQSQQVNFGNSAIKNSTQWFRPNTPTNQDGNREVVGWIKAFDIFYMSMDTIRFDVLAGTGNRMVMAKPNGDMYTTALPTINSYSQGTGINITGTSPNYTIATDMSVVMSKSVANDSIVAMRNALAGKMNNFTYDWSTLPNKPTFFDGQYSSLSGLPTLFNGQYSSLTGLPTLFNGDYNTLTNKPTIPTTTSQLTNNSGFLTSVPAQTWTSITGKPTFSTVSTTGAYSDLTGKPTIKRQETYAGTTNSSGVYTITYGTAYSSVPNVQYNLGTGANNKMTILLLTSTTTGCSFKVELRSDVLGLLPTYSNVNGQAVGVLVTE